MRSLDAYLDAVARPATRTEDIGPFTLFVNEGRGWRYYARPTPGVRGVTESDVVTVRARQRELAQPEDFEWIVDLTPDVGPACAATGLHVVEGRPLMVLPRDRFTPVGPPDGAEARFVSPDDDLATMLAIAAVAYSSPGTDIGEEGPDALAKHASDEREDVLDFQRERIASMRTICVWAWADGRPVASGAHQPIDGTTEIVGVATLPAYRRRGLGALVTSVLAADAFARGIETVLLSAGNETIARIYARLGFERVGTVGDATLGAH